MKLKEAYQDQKQEELEFSEKENEYFNRKYIKGFEKLPIVINEKSQRALDMLDYSVNKNPLE